MKAVGLFDDKGREIHDGDTVEVWDKIETKTSHKSVVSVTPSGVFIEGHPAHKALGLGEVRNLAHYCDYGHGGKYNVSCKIIDSVDKDIHKEPQKKECSKCINFRDTGSSIEGYCDCLGEFTLRNSFCEYFEG